MLKNFSNGCTLNSVESILLISNRNFPLYRLTARQQTIKLNNVCSSGKRITTDNYDESC